MAELLIINPSPRPSKRRRTVKKAATRKGVKSMAKKRRSPAQLANDARLGRMAKARAKARRTGSRTTTAKTAPAKRRKYKRNPTSIVHAGTRKPVSKKAWRASGYRRNPIKRAGGMLGNIVNDTLIPAATAAGGALALDIAWGFLPIPANLKTGPLRHAVKGAGAIGLGMVAGMVVSKKTAQQLSLGAMTVVVYNAYRDMLAQFAPGVALGAYMEEPIPAGNGMGAYLEGIAQADDNGTSYDLGGNDDAYDLGATVEGDYSYNY
jgi:hypothetical protein